MSTLPLNGLMLASFLATTSLVLLTFLIVSARKSSAQRRLGNLAGTDGSGPDRANLPDGRTSRADPSSSMPPSTVVVQCRIDRQAARSLQTPKHTPQGRKNILE